MTKDNDVINYMRRVSLFDGFSEEELRVLSVIFRIRRLDAGEVLAREGDPAPSFFIVVAGTINIIKEITPNLRQKMAVVHRNMMLGQVPLIDGGRRVNTLEAASPTILLECDRSDFERLFKANSVFAYKVIDFVLKDLSKRLRQTNQLLEQLLANPGRTLSMVYNAFVEVGKVMHTTGEFPSVGRR